MKFGNEIDHLGTAMMEVDFQREQMKQSFERYALGFIVLSMFMGSILLLIAIFQ